MRPLKPSKNFHRWVRVFDWTLAAASLAYGVWSINYWWIGGGIGCLCLAYFDPGKRLRKYFTIIQQARGPAVKKKR